MNLEKFKAVYIDDDSNNLMLLEAFCQEIGLNVKLFDNSVKGLEYVLKNEVDVLFVDYMMPEIDGLDIIKEVREHFDDIVIIMITAAGEDYELKIEALKNGATDFLAKPIDFTEFKVRVRNLLKLKNRALLLKEEINKATSVIKERELETLNVLGNVAEYKDPETASHIARVANYSKLIAIKNGNDSNFCDMIFYASPLHDVGKVGIPDNILLKPGRLDEKEFEVMKTHAKIGWEMLKDAKNKYLRMGADIAYCHHEKFDGSGYPRNLRGEEIPLSARIVAVADVFDALTSIRPYKKAWDFEKALDYIKDGSGKHFDPNIVKLFSENIDEVKTIYKKFQEQ